VHGLLAAHVLSVLGNAVTLVALPLYVYGETGSAALTGVLAVATSLPVVLGGALGGVLVDRFGYRRSSMVSDLVGAATIGAVPLLHVTVGLPMWLLLVLVLATGLLDTPGQGARTALVPEAAEKGGVPLERAMGWWGAGQRAATMVGAPVAGLLVAWWGPVVVLVVNAATFLVSAALVRWAVPASLETAPEAPEPALDYRHELLAGLRVLWASPLLRAVVAMVLLTNALDIGLLNVALPVYAEVHLGGARAYGLLVGLFGAGALAGALLYSAVGHRLPRRWVFAVGFALTGPPMCLVLAATPGVVACATALVVGGIAAGSINPVLGTVLLEQVPARMRARVNGAVSAGAWSAMPVGALGAGLLIDGVGVAASLAIMGALYVVIVAGPFVLPVWRGLDRPAVEPVPAG